MASPRELLEMMMKERDRLEAEAEAIRCELESAPDGGGRPAGMRGSLVDDEGFPRADVDVYRVRTLRNCLACIQTDHKALMAKIEKLLPTLLAPGGGGESRDVERASSTLSPFAMVESVKDQSPADCAGLLTGDALLKYGAVTNLADVKQFTLDHVNETFTIMVDRNNTQKVLQVTPKAWHGDGLLGCHFTPLAIIQ